MTENQRLRRQVRQLLEEKRKLEEKLKQHDSWKDAVETPAGERGYWVFKTAVWIALVTIFWALINSVSTRFLQMPLESPEIRIDLQVPFGKNETP